MNLPVIGRYCKKNGLHEKPPSLILLTCLGVILILGITSVADHGSRATIEASESASLPENAGADRRRLPDGSTSRTAQVRRLETDSITGQSRAGAAEALVIGTNLDSIADWTMETAFTDLFKMSRPWCSGTARQWDDKRCLDLDKHGWVRSLQPGQIARTVVLSGGVNQTPSGRYVLTYQGRGKLEYNGQGVRLISSASGRDIIELNPEKGMFNLFIRDTDPSNYIRNIQVRKESDPDGAVFRQAFLDRLANYRVIRFMNWMAANKTRLSRWQDRPRPDDARWSINGAPVEIMVALCNTLQADPWFTLPHMADDHFVREFAKIVKQTLHPQRKIYVEHSNEVWNGLFPQAQYAREEGRRRGLGDNPFEGQMLYHARRTTEIGHAFVDILGKDRVVRVLGAWSHHHGTTQTMLRFDDTARHVDAVAVAPYFGGYLGSSRQQARVEQMTIDDLFNELNSVAVPEIRKEIAGQINVAGSYHLPLIAYEGGQHLVGVGPVKQNGHINQLFDAANSDPRMGEIYKVYLSAWRELGGGLFVHYKNCSRMSIHGRFGALESLVQPIGKAPKFSALQSFSSNRVRP